MAQAQAKELASLTHDELKEMLNVRKKELFGLRIQAKMGKLEKHSTVRTAKKDIARILTLIRQKEPQ